MKKFLKIYKGEQMEFEDSANICKRRILKMDHTALEQKQGLPLGMF